MRALFLFASVVVFSFSAQARDLRMIYKNNRAVGLFKKEKRQEAFEQFLGLTATDPNDVQLKFNMAASLQALGEEEKAIKINNAIIKDIDQLLAKATSDDSKTALEEAEIQQLSLIKFGTYFNSGVSHQMMQNNEEALKNYQLALEIMPDSKEIKTNIELMFVGGGGGKGKDKNKDKQKGDGEGDGEQGDEDQDQQDQKDQSQGQDEQKKQQEQKQQQKQPKEFDQKYMSKEDLQRIMEELNGQEQKIRAKMERKGGKSGPKDKEW